MPDEQALDGRELINEEEFERIRRRHDAYLEEMRQRQQEAEAPRQAVHRVDRWQGANWTVTRNDNNNLEFVLNDPPDLIDWQHAPVEPAVRKEPKEFVLNYDGYICSICHRKGVKLWRNTRPQIIITLMCCWCAAEERGLDLARYLREQNEVSRSKTIFTERDNIGDWIPAILTPNNAYLTIPVRDFLNPITQKCVDAWKKLKD